MCETALVSTKTGVGNRATPSSTGCPITGGDEIMRTRDKQRRSPARRRRAYDDCQVLCHDSVDGCHAQAPDKVGRGHVSRQDRPACLRVLVPHPTRRLDGSNSRIVASPGWVGDGSITRSAMTHPNSCRSLNHHRIHSTDSCSMRRCHWRLARQCGGGRVAHGFSRLRIQSSSPQSEPRP